MEQKKIQQNSTTRTRCTNRTSKDVLDEYNLGFVVLQELLAGYILVANTLSTHARLQEHKHIDLRVAKSDAA
jgi:hypothetical protein